MKAQTRIGTGRTLTGFSLLRLVRNGVAGALPILRDFDSFLEKLPELDGYYADKVANAKANGAVLRYIGKIS